MKLPILLISLLCSWQALAQYRVSGRVVDEKGNGPLASASVFIRNTQCGDLSDNDGRFSFECDKFGEKAQLVIRLLGYEEYVVELKPGQLTALEIELKERPTDLPPAVVRAVVVDTVWGSEELNVADFAFYGEGMMLLTYQKEDRWKRQEDRDVTLYSGASVIWVGPDDSEYRGGVFDEPMVSLYDTYPGALFAKGHKKNYEVVPHQGGLSYIPVADSVFSNLVAPVVDTLKQQLVLTSYHPQYPAFEYSLYNPGDSSYRTLRQIVDEETMELFRSEFKYLHPREKLEAFRYELKTGIEKEIVAAFMSGFSKSAYYREPNAPLFAWKDSVWVFDHTHDQLITYDGNGLATDSLSLQYHHVKRPDLWSGKVLQDNSTGLFYTLISRNGVHRIHPLDTRGNLGAPITLYHKYVDQLKIHDGWIYYIYRPFESSQKRFLYREPLG
ncbi:MAG: carboxypeptidase-like regulatory domain-containing protein [Flavobacteriales bacterium]|nr:carboxypeptidase-like regulatory domain-containing protein [Flavobacteriales bacterium]